MYTEFKSHEQFYYFTSKANRVS